MINAREPRLDNLRRFVWHAATYVSLVSSAFVLSCNAAYADERAVGTASAGLSRSAAVLDLNGDGVVDLAVADRLSFTDSGDYEVHVALTGGTAETLRVRSPLRVLRLIAVDIDDDHDVDLVLTPILDGRIVSVWLNDGHGHFSLTSNRALPAAIPRIHALVLIDAPGSLTASVLPRSNIELVQPPSHGPPTGRERIAGPPSPRQPYSNDYRPFPPRAPPVLPVYRRVAA